MWRWGDGGEEAGDTLGPATLRTTAHHRALGSGAPDKAVEYDEKIVGNSHCDTRISRT